MSFAEYYSNTAKKKTKGGRGSNTILIYHGWGMELQNMCIWSFFRVVCHFWTSDGSDSESYAKGFHFQVFHKLNEFSINCSFSRLFVGRDGHFGPRYSNETKRPLSETTKQHVPQLITKSPTKGCLQVMICYKKEWSLLTAVCYNYLKLVINSRFFRSAIFLSQTSYILI